MNHRNKNEERQNYIYDETFLILLFTKSKIKTLQNLQNETPAQKLVSCLAYFVLALKKMYSVKNFLCFFCNYFFLR